MSLGAAGKSAHATSPRIVACRAAGAGVRLDVAALAEHHFGSAEIVRDDILLRHRAVAVFAFRVIDVYKRQGRGSVLAARLCCADSAGPSKERRIRSCEACGAI